MDLKVNIEQELWRAIEKNYENESYSTAILDAMHLLTDTIRNKTGLEGDGSGLIGQAFGGESPKLQLNKLQTESEKNIQKGMQELLRGLYTTIRNPRSHERYNDSKEEADSIIYFISYLLKTIDKSKTSFEKSTFLQRVFDEYYVKTKEYSDLLVKEIPKRQRVDIAISIILARRDGDSYKLSYFMNSLFDKLEETDILRVYKVISEELKYTSEHDDIATILHIVPSKYWSRLDKAVKIRIEEILYQSAEKGKYDSSTQECRLGSLGTWINAGHLVNFEDFGDWMYMLLRKIKSGDTEEVAYIENFYWSKICEVNRDDINFWLKDYIATGFNNNDEKIINKLNSQIMFEESHPWWNVFEEELKNYPDIVYRDLPF
ncbi:TIGR02391 family protein [Bacillus sp. NPDC094106]|uniref:TIGR02391 family protein n=1 Tax=Bacillus sp. NPDC094106 TaxID=3363949 RepID=UPI00382D283B